MLQKYVKSIESRPAGKPNPLISLRPDAADQLKEALLICNSPGTVWSFGAPINMVRGRRRAADWRAGARESKS